MRGMRNRLAHGYFDINLNVVGYRVLIIAGASGEIGRSLEGSIHQQALKPQD
jgi:hypothetical protein